MDVTTAFWGMTINHYDETDLALVQQGYPDHVRQIVYTLERGEKGTPHIQAYLRLYRQQRLSYVKKLFPRGSFKALLADEYKLNAQRYAQKLDATAESPAVITNNPFPDPVVELTSVTRAVRDNFMSEDDPNTVKQAAFLLCCRNEEQQRVREKPSLAKFYVSATYKSVKKEFWRSILQHVVEEEVAQKNETHTHTHTQRKILFSTGSITSDGEEVDQGSCASGGQEDEDDYYSEGSEDEADTESERSECSEEDDCSEC